MSEGFSMQCSPGAVFHSFFFLSVKKHIVSAVNSYSVEVYEAGVCSIHSLTTMHWST